MQKKPELTLIFMAANNPGTCAHTSNSLKPVVAKREKLQLKIHVLEPFAHIAVGLLKEGAGKC